MSVSQLPARSQQQQPPNHAPQAQGAGAAMAPKAAAPKKGGVLGWMQRAGQWVSDKAASASAAVGEAVEGTKRVAKDAWDVAKATDIGWKDGSLQVETDLDELLDLVPAHIKAALQLDREGADNVCKVSMNPLSGVIVLTSDALAIGAVDAAGLKTGPATLRGVRIEIARPGGGLKEVDPKDAAGASAVKVHVEAADVRDVRVQTSTGPITVDRVELAGFVGDLGSRGGPLSVAGDEGQASVMLKNAVITGLQAQGHAVSSLQIDGLSGGLSAGGERAHLEAEALSVRGASTGGQKVGDASLKGARVDLQNQGGGLPLADSKADHLRAKVAVEAAEVHDFDGEEADLKSARATKLAATYDQDQGDTAVQAARLDAAGIDTAWLDADQTGVSGLDLKLHSGPTRTGLSVGAEKLTGRGLRADSGAAKPKGADPSLPLDWSANIGEAELSDLQAGSVSLGGLRGKGVSAEGAADGARSRYGASAQQLGADRVRQGDISIGDINAIDAAVSGSADGAHLSAAAVSANNIDGNVLKAGQVRGKGATADIGPSGASATLDSGSVRDALIMGRVAVAEGNIEGLAAGPAAGGRSLSVNNADVRGVSDTVTGAKLGGAQLRGAAMTTQGDSLSGSLDALAAQEMSGFGAGARSAEVAGLTFAKAGDTASGAAKSAALRGVTGPQGAKADAIDARGVAGSVGKNEVSGAIDGLSATGVAGAGYTAASLRADGLAASRTGDRTEGSLRSLSATTLAGAPGSVGALSASGLRGSSDGGVDSASLDEISVSDVKAKAGTLKGAHATGLSATRDAQGLRGGVDALEASGLSGAAGGARGSVASLSASDLSVRQSGSATDARLGALDAQGVALNSGGADASLRRLQLSDAQVHDDAKGRSAAVGGLHATGAKVSATGGGGAGAPSGLNTGALISTLAPRIHDADVNFSAPLKAGEVPGAPVKVKKGTAVDGSVQVRDNRFVPGGTGATLSKNLDGPAWTGVKGAYMNQDGELKADLTGTLGIDMDVGGKINDSLGIRGEALPSVGALGQAYAKQPAAPTSGGPSAADIVDLSRHQANGNVSLSAGQVDAGAAGGAQIARGQRPGDNRIDFQSDGQTGAQATMRRILLGSARAKQGGVDAKVGRTSAEGVRVGQSGGATRAELDALDLQGLSLSEKKS